VFRALGVKTRDVLRECWETFRRAGSARCEVASSRSRFRCVQQDRRGHQLPQKPPVPLLRSM
jgi:hypothetical protein